MKSRPMISRLLLTITPVVLMIATSNRVLGQVTAYSIDANTVLLDHFDGATGASIFAYVENGAVCGSTRPSATPSYSYGAGPGGLNQCLTMNPPAGQPLGSATYLQYPGGELLSQSNGTIELWLYATSYGTGLALVEQGQYYGACSGWTFGLAVSTTGQLSASAWAAFSMTSGTATVPLGRWTHIAVTWGSAGAKLYINGLLVGSDVNTGMPASGYSGSVLVRAGTQGGVSASIDELRISNVQRTAFNVVNFTPASPKVTSFTPISGSIGTSVTITGTNFNSTASKNFVLVGGLKAPVASGNSTSLTITIPTGVSSGIITVLDSATQLSGYSRTPFNVTFASSRLIDGSSFASKVDTSTGNGPRGITLSDFDGDGKNDLAVANYTDNTITFLRNTSVSGAVTFGAATTVATGVNPITMAIGDFNGDGKIDVVTTNSGANTVSILRNTSTPGALSFATKIDSSTGTFPYGVAVCDIDGDGKPDIVVTNANSNTISILKNTSSGSISFATKVDLPTGVQPYGVTFADVNNDGLPDIVVTARTDNSITIFRNNSIPGILSVAPSLGYTTGTNPNYVVAGDLDGDLLPDLATSNIGNQTVSVFRNMTSGGSVSFATRIDSTTGNSPYDVALGDFDGDGKSDLVTCANGITALSVHRNTSTTGSISFLSNVNFSTGTSPRFVAIGDIDGDGKPDMVAANFTANTVSILRNTITVPSIISFGVDMSKQRAIGTFQTGDTIKVLVFTPNVGRTTPAQGKILGISQTAGPTVFRDTISFGAYTGPIEYKFWNSRTALNTGYEGIVGPGSGTYGNRVDTAVTGLRTVRTVFFNNDSALAITSVTPSSGSIGSSVTINGYRFNPVATNDVVRFGSVNAVVTGSSASSLTVTVPLGATYGPITVTDTTTDRTAYSKSSFVVTFASSRVINTSSFAAKVDSTVGTAPRGTVIGDFDGNGKNEIAVVNYSSNSVNVLKNNSLSGVVSLQTQASLTTGTNPMAIAAGDFDGDGKLDLVVTNMGANTISIFKNLSTPGAIAFAAKIDSSTGTTPYFVAVQDIDGDGKPDIVVANAGSNSFSVFRNTSNSGTISFAQRADLTTGSTPYGVTIADINGDGSPDVVIANYGANTVSVFRNTSVPGALSFATSVDNSTGLNPYFVTAGDLDGDNLPDLVTANPGGGSISILRNTTSGGTISFAARIDSSILVPYNIALTDLDGDGRPDIVVSNRDSNSVSVYKNKSISGAISVASLVKLPVGLSPRFVSAGDIDGDGKPDLVSANFNANTISVLRNTVSPALPPRITSIPTSGSTGATISITGTNFNTLPAADRVFFGAVKAAVTSATSTSLSVTVPTGATYSRISVTDTTTGLTGYSTLQFTPTFQSNQTIDASTFAPKSDVTAATNPWSIQAVDVDGDGKTDLVAANDGANSLSFYRNTSSLGNITFATRIDSVIGQQPKSVAYGDLDGDGRQDFVTTNQNSNTLSIYRNTSSPGLISLAAKIALADTGGPFSAAIADMDGDGKPDIIVANIGANKISVLRNTSTVGNLSFAAPVYFAANTSTCGVTVGDIDGDGLPDIVATNLGASSITVFRNTSTVGNISFAVGLEYSTGTNTGPWAACLGDLDLDGKLDIVVVNNTASSVSVFRNQSTVGTIALAPRQDQGVNTGPWQAILGDIDGDGKPDIIVAYHDVAAVSVMKNTSVSGSISWASKVDYATTNTTWGVVAADLDADGKPDLAATNYNSSSISILRNTAAAYNVVSFGVNMSKQRASGAFQTGDTVRVLVFSPTSLNRSLPLTGKILGIAPASGTDIYRDTVNVGTYTGAISYKFWKNRGSSDSVRYEQPYGSTGNRLYTVGLGSNTLANAYFSADSVGAPVATSATNIKSTSFTANWNSVVSSTGYLLDVSTSSSFASYVSGYQAKSVGTVTSTSLSGLASSTSYFYRLRTTSSNGTSINSNPVWVVTSPAPSISSFSPSSGTVGSTVTITGANFSPTAGNNIVFFGGVKATASAATATSVTTTVPPGATYQPITVTVDGLTAYSKAPFLVRFSGGGAIVANSFAQNVDFATSTSPISVALSDIDGDGKLDLVCTNGSSNVSVYRNTSSAGTISSGSFGSRVDFSTGGGRFMVAIGDLDGDGKPDLVVANTSGFVSVFRNTSTSGSITSASFATHVDFAAGSSPTSVAIGDLDGDGRPDIVVTNSGSNTVSVFRNTGTSGSLSTSSFAAKVDFITGSTPEVVAIGDLDGDGKPDLAVANNASNTVSVFRNTSTAGSITTSSFASKVDFTTGSNPFSVAIGDLDGDGKLDLIVSSQINNSVSVLRNTSTSGSITSGSFASRVDFATGANPFSVAIGDLDGDGKPDLAVANSAANTVSVLRNTSTSGSITASSFAAKVDFNSGGNPYSVAIGDIDGDGKPELVTANYNANSLSVLLNTVGSLVPTITVSTPSTNWATSYAYTVNWKSQNLTGNVNIRLSTDNGSTFSTAIALNTSNLGAYSWYVPSTQSLSNMCILRVESATNTSIYGLSNVFSIVNGNNVNYSQPATVSATYSPNPTNNSEYRLISIPGNVNGMGVSNLGIKGNKDQDWKMFREPGNSAQGFIQMDYGSSMKTGEGYWFIQKGPLSMDVSFVTPSLDNDATVTIYLTGGTYSIIGNPFNVPIPWSSVLSLNGLPSNTPLFSWNGSWSSANTSLQPGVGYYINSTGLPTLKIPYAAFGFPSQAAGEALKTEWKLQLAYESVSNKDDDNYIGIAEGTSVGKDRFEFNKPPLIFDGSFLYMKRSGWDSHNDMFYSDYRPAVGDGQTWDFEIANPGKSLGKVAVAGVEKVPTAYKVYLVNEETGVTLNLRRQDWMQYGYGRTTGHFKIVVGPQDYVSQELEQYIPREFSLEQNYPNPFNPSTTVTFKMPKEGSVRLEVFSLLGQRVKVLAEGAYEAGVHQVVWMGDNDWGARVASGVYFCRFVMDKRTVETKKMLLTK